MDIITSEKFLSVPHKLSIFDSQNIYFTQSSPNELNFQEVPNLVVKNHWKLSTKKQISTPCIFIIFIHIQGAFKKTQKFQMILFGFPYISTWEHRISKILVSIPHNYEAIMGDGTHFLKIRCSQSEIYGKSNIMIWNYCVYFWNALYLKTWKCKQAS